MKQSKLNGNVLLFLLGLLVTQKITAQEDCSTAPYVDSSLNEVISNGEAWHQFTPNSEEAIIVLQLDPELMNEYPHEIALYKDGCSL